MQGDKQNTTLSGAGENEEDDNVAIAANSREIQFNALNECYYAADSNRNFRSA